MLGGLFRQRRARYDMNEDEKFYLMSCSDLLGEITPVSYTHLTLPTTPYV